MSERLPCPVCEQARDVDAVEREETVSLKGKEIHFSAVMYHCPVCGEDFEAPGQLDRNLLAAREVYARLYESPRPEQIVALRSRYGASQKAFGLILGFGELTSTAMSKGQFPTQPTACFSSSPRIPLSSGRCTRSTARALAPSSASESNPPRGTGRQRSGEGSRRWVQRRGMPGCTASRPSSNRGMTRAHRERK